jgi:hypothetical protein
MQIDDETRQTCLDALVSLANSSRAIAFGRTDDESKQTGSFWTTPFKHCPEVRAAARIDLGRAEKARIALGDDEHSTLPQFAIDRYLDPNWVDYVYDLSGAIVGKWQGDRVVPCEDTR